MKRRTQLRLDRVGDFVSVLSGSGLHADQYAGTRRVIASAAADVLDRRLPEAEIVNLMAHRSDVDDMGGLRFELYSAREIDTQIEALDGDRNDGRQHQQPVHCECVVAPADEIDIRVVRQKSQKRHGAVRLRGWGRHSRKLCAGQATPRRTVRPDLERRASSAAPDLTYYCCWRPQGESNPCFSLERAAS